MRSPFQLVDADQRADDGAENGAAAAAQRGAADHDGRDGIEFVAASAGWAELRREAMMRPRCRRSPRNRVDNDLPVRVPPDRHGLLVRAEGEGIAAERRARQNQARCDRDDELEDENAVRYGKERQNPPEQRPEIGGKFGVSLKRSAWCRKSPGTGPSAASSCREVAMRAGSSSSRDELATAQPPGGDRSQDADRHRQPPIGEEDAGDHGTKRHPGC